MATAHCFGCRTSTPLRNPSHATSSNGRNLLKGTCSVCGRACCRIVAGSQAGGRLHHADDLPADHIITIIKHRDPNQPIPVFLDALGDKRVREIARLPLADLLYHDVIFLGMGRRSKDINEVVLASKMRYETHLQRRPHLLNVPGRPRPRRQREDEDEGED